MRIIKYIFVGILFVLFSATNVSSQTQNDLPKNLMLAFKQGNCSSLSNYFSDRIQLSIQDKEGNYSKSQAKQILDKFFRDYPPTDFKKKHAGGKTGARYATGELITKKGNFRLSFLSKKQNGKFIIHQLHIEKD
ncbi:DUF4783 domain-containing protein [Marinifilum sp. D714]|uniref:DUF4783 domain-containing protein n=1 Tax=Marinifilum sp. D714 TaxID=2937523 RepID=UPI0027CB7FF6|nr:DUF4783 domain-containing protein [Marinifilum sp. D714]MDQ2179281.1 DUF4783 domain-containing protein [Marinifilum sp. D714]